MTSKRPSKYTQLSVKAKLDIIALVNPLKSIRSVARDCNVSEASIRGWIINTDKLRAMIKDLSVKIACRKRLFGGGLKAKFSNLEAQLIQYIEDRNKKGLCVKDRYIIANAIRIKNEILSLIMSLNLDEEIIQLKNDLENFKASTNWCYRFKQRYNLVSRRQTSTRKLPENFNEIAIDFIGDIQETIKKHNVSPINIINLDQVPRYFEHEPTSTLIKKGSRDVFLRKASTSHRRFTYTPSINANGDFENNHLLFSKLKNKPTVADGFSVSVNVSGMWNEEILKHYYTDVILKRPRTSLLKQSVILIMDSYPVHEKVAKEIKQKYEDKYNIFIRLIPACMTGLLQPLDVAVNRSFQTFYNREYDAYMTKAFSDKNLQTKAGNIKSPSYIDASTWINNWIQTKSKDDIAKAFKVCGLYPGFAAEPDQIEHLHQPLRECFGI